MNLQKSFLITAILLMCWGIEAQVPSWHCANLGARIRLDERLIKGDLKLPALSKAEFECLGEFYAQRDLNADQYTLFESTAHPQYAFNGYSICSLEKYQINYQQIPDLLHEKEIQDKIMVFIKRYNEIVLPTYQKRIPKGEMEQILSPAPVIDPYVLKERLAILKQKNQAVVQIEPQDDYRISVKLAINELFDGINLPLERLQFIVIDEYTNVREILTIKQLKQKGFILETDESRTKSAYWYDFRIRAEYAELAKEGLVVSCEKTEDYFFHFEHFSITKDLRLISHEH